MPSHPPKSITFTGNYFPETANNSLTYFSRMAFARSSISDKQPFIISQKVYTITAVFSKRHVMKKPPLL
jgi:hypothetical protein